MKSHLARKSSRHRSPVALGDVFAQVLCKECGLCCNGTLFSYVPLTDGELAPRPSDRVVLEDGQVGLAQKCRFYQNKLCAIYEIGRPHSCVTFECKLLKRHARGKISREQALDEIHTTMFQVDQVKTHLQALTGTNARNLTDLYKGWLDSIGGCHSDWSEKSEATLASYSALVSHLQQTFGLAQEDEKQG